MNKKVIIGILVVAAGIVFGFAYFNRNNNITIVPVTHDPEVVKVARKTIVSLEALRYE